MKRSSTSGRIAILSIICTGNFSAICSGNTAISQPGNALASGRIPESVMINIK